MRVHYKAARYSKKYLAEHEAELATYRAARAAMNELLGGEKLPKIDALKKQRRVLAVILVIHDGARSPVNNIGQLLLRHPAGLPRPLDGEPYIVKIKSSIISLNLHNIT